MRRPKVNFSRTYRLPGYAFHQRLVEQISNELALCGRYFIHGWEKERHHPKFLIHLSNVSTMLLYVSETEKRNAEKRLYHLIMESVIERALSLARIQRKRMAVSERTLELPVLYRDEYGMYHVWKKTPDL